MRALVLCALALALAVDATVVRVHPATKAAKLQPARLSAELTEALWHQPAGGAAMGDDAVIAGPFHVYYDLQRAAVDEAAYAECERFGGDVAARHACRAAKAGPTASEAAAVRTWLAPLGVAASMGAAGCHFAWNAVHCRDVRAGAVRRVFSAPAAPFRTYQRRVGGGASVVAADRYQFTEAALAIPASVAGVVSHVSGLQPFNHVQLAGKHTGVTAPQQQAKSRGKGEDGSASTTSGSSSGSSGPWPQVSPTQLNSFVIPDGDASPIVLHSDGHVVIFALRCAGGELSDNAKYVNASNGVAWENYCPTGKGPTSAPVVALRPRSFAAAPSSAAAVLTAEATVQHCESADVLNSASVSSQNVVVCAVELPAPAAGAIAAFEQLETTVTVAFASGPVVGQAAAFYNGTVYVPGQVNPWTGETIAAAPATPTLTVPSASFVLPATMYEQYAIPREASAAGMVQGVVEFSDVGQPRNGLNISDVPAFLKLINSTASAADLFVIGADSIVSQFETTLDIELIMSMAPGAITYVYCISYGSGATYAGYSDALIGFAATGANVTAGGHAPSAVWSISYGGPEWTTEPSTYEHANTLLGHLSDAGVTVLASSGDQGAYFYEVEMFFGVVVQQFMNFGPSFPAASPHVVAVGASAYRARTQAAAGPSAATYVERVCSVADNNIITSGGGISAFWPTPSYQAPFNSNAKLGVPDVATVGAWIMVVVNGQVQPLFGTSASSPIFGGMVTLLNAQRARTATNATLRAPLRQVPSLLYSTMRAARAAGASTATPFTDVTEGDNCAGEPVQPGWSNNYPVYSRSNCYAAEAGWDAVSGLGTPLFRNLLPAALQWDPRV